jgi:hypothetical protein
VVGYSRRKHDIEYSGGVVSCACSSCDTGIDYQRWMEYVDHSQCADGSIYFADTALHGDYFATGDVSGVELRSVYGGHGVILYDGQKQLQFFAHGYYYGSFHLALFGDCRCLYFQVCKITKKIRLPFVGELLLALLNKN